MGSVIGVFVQAAMQAFLTSAAPVHGRKFGYQMRSTPRQISEHRASAEETKSQLEVQKEAQKELEERIRQGREAHRSCEGQHILFQFHSGKALL